MVITKLAVLLFFIVIAFSAFDGGNFSPFAPNGFSGIARRSKPDMERRLRVPFVLVFPLIGAALSVYLMTKLPLDTWLRFIGWLALGLVIYAVYGYRHSRLRRDA